MEFESPEISDIYDLYALNHFFFQSSMNRIPDEAFEKIQADSTAPYQWIAAHLTNTKCRAANALGATFDLPWDKEVGGMKSAYQAGESYPTKDEINDIWNPVTDRFLELLTQVTDVQLKQKIENQLPGVPSTIRGLLTFLCFHEAYHIGQLGLLVKSGGGKPLANPG